MKPNGKHARGIALLVVLWVTIGGVWFAGLNWPKWIASGSDAAPARAAETAADTVIYTLSSSDETSAEPGSDEPDVIRTAQTAEPAPEDVKTIPEDAPAAPGVFPSEQTAEPETDAPYVLNTNSKKIHLPGCSSVKDIKESNKAFCDDPEEALAQGYEWCKRCHG